MLETGTRMIDVPYRGGGGALVDMMAGTTQLMFPQLPAVLGMVKSGQVRALAVTSRHRLPQLPDVPTLDESGLPGFHVTSWNQLFGPRGLPDTVRDILSNALVDAIRKDADIRARMATLGVTPLGEVAAHADAFFNQELDRWRSSSTAPESSCNLSRRGRHLAPFVIASEAKQSRCRTRLLRRATRSSQ